LLKIQLSERTGNLFAQTGIPKLLALLQPPIPEREIAKFAQTVGYSRVQSWRVAKRVVWLSNEGAIRDGCLLLSPYDRRFDCLFRYRYLRPLLRCLEEFGPLHMRYLSRLLRVDVGLTSRMVENLERAGLVTVNHGKRGAKGIVEIHSEIQRPISNRAELVPQPLKDVVRTFLASFQSKLSHEHVRCVIFSYRDTEYGTMSALPRNMEDELVLAVKEALVKSADEVMMKNGFWIGDLTIISRVAWLRQLLDVSQRIDPEIRETFDSPPVLGMKPHPDQLFEALFMEDGRPPSPIQVENWLKRKLIQQAGTGYSFTSRGFRAIKMKSRLYLKPRAAKQRIGQRVLHLIYS